MTVNEEKTIERVRKSEKEDQYLFVVYDRVANEYSEPKLFLNGGCALRWFNDLLKKSSFPADDFELLYVGDMDMNTGIISGNEKPLFWQRGIDEDINILRTNDKEI